MVKLKHILQQADLKSIHGNENILPNGINFDSRSVKPGDAFIAVKGILTDGHLYIQQAIDNGALIVVCEDLPEKTSKHVAYYAVKDSGIALGILSSWYYDNPSQKLRLVGVTGTNGKTTVATQLFNLMQKLGYSCGLLSTVANYINEIQTPATHTTPDPLMLNALLAKMVEAGCEYCFMEVSSHAIHQNRIAGLNFLGAIFTNITRDHLDYHGTFDQYIAAKRKFFDDLPSTAFALVNIDDRNGITMFQNSKASKYTYGLKGLADFKSRIIESHIDGLYMFMDGVEIWSALPGEFNASNLTAVYGTAILLGMKKEEVLVQLSKLKPVSGRFERIKSPEGITAIVDYAHTPDALLNVLKAIKQICSGNEKIITVVGAGGNRDKGKRPMMGKIAVEFSHQVILTSDNPRDEDPETILHEMAADISPVERKKVLKITDRAEAIKTAIALAKPEDIILVAGKGHENYQEIKGIKYPFDDKVKIVEIFNHE